MEVTLFEGVEPDPSVETVFKGAEVMRGFNPDWIVSIGGGSPIDAAKAMWAFYEYPDITFESLTIPFNFPTLRTKAKFCAIPSTSGTATEVTAFSVITDYAKGIKYPLADFNITPDVAIIDSDLALTMPPKLTAHTGMDAITHAIEAYVSTLHCDYTDPLALHAIKMISENIMASYKGDADARAKMHNALRGWPSVMPCSVLFIQWLIKPARPIRADISYMAPLMPCIFPRSLNTTPGKKPPRIGM
jgi:alcohol dehydrogenase class IV